MERRRRIFGIIALVLGLLALGASTIPYFAPQKNPPPVEEIVADSASRIKDAVAAKLKGEKRVAASSESNRGYNTASIVRFVGVSLAFGAIALGTIGYARREDKRVCLPATILGVSAMAIQFFIVAIVLVLIVAIIAVVLSKLDL